MIANADNVIRFELSLYDGDNFVTGQTVPASVRRLSDGKFLMSAGTWQVAYTTIDMGELTGNDGVEGRYFLDLAAQASPDIYMFRALFTFAGEANADVWETQTDAEAFRLTAARAAVLDDWINGGRLDVLLDAVKAVTDVLPNAGALTGISNSTDRLTAVRAAVLTDWIDGGRLDLLLDAVKAITDVIPDNGALTSLPTHAELRTALGVNGSDVIAELAQGVPSATPSLSDAVMLLYMVLRNGHDVTATLMSIKNDTGTVIAKGTLSDDTTTFVKAKLVSGA